MKTFRHDWHFSDYLNPGVLRLIDAPAVRSICELGACDGRDTVALQTHFDADVHAFECNPAILPATRRCIRDHPAAGRIRLVEKAAWDRDGRIPFYPVVRAAMDNGAEEENPGASSCFRARDDYRQRYEQGVTEVETVRLDAYCDSFGIEGFDLLCMDVQGAALHALLGLGDRLGCVRYVLAELENRPIYHDQDMFPEVRDHLAAHGFRVAAEVRRDAWFSDYLFIAAPARLRLAARWRERLARLRRG